MPLGSALASGGGGERASASDSPALSPCDLNAGPRFRCGRIAVPAVRGDPSVGDQSIFFAVRTRDLAKKPAVGTIFAVEGGPGYASTNFDSAKSYRAVFGPLLRRRDLVLIDQRGTGHSQAVNCAQLQRGMVPEQIAVASCANQLVLAIRASPRPSPRPTSRLSAPRSAWGRSRSMGTHTGPCWHRRTRSVTRRASARWCSPRPTRLTMRSGGRSTRRRCRR